MIRTCLEDNGSFPPKISEQTSWSQQASTLSTETNNLSFQAAYWHHVCFAISSRQLKRELQKLMLKRPLAAKVHECMRTGMTFTLCNDQLNHNVSSRSIMPTGQNHVKITLSTQLHVKVIFHRWQLPTHHPLRQRTVNHTWFHSIAANNPHSFFNLLYFPSFQGEGGLSRKVRKCFPNYLFLHSWSCGGHN